MLGIKGSAMPRTHLKWMVVFCVLAYAQAHCLLRHWHMFRMRMYNISLMQTYVLSSFWTVLMRFPAPSKSIHLALDFFLVVRPVLADLGAQVLELFEDL